MNKRLKKYDISAIDRQVELNYKLLRCPHCQGVIGKRLVTLSSYEKLSDKLKYIWWKVRPRLLSSPRGRDAFWFWLFFYVLSLYNCRDEFFKDGGKIAPYAAIPIWPFNTVAGHAMLFTALFLGIVFVVVGILFWSASNSYPVVGVRHLDDDDE